MNSSLDFAEAWCNAANFFVLLFDPPSSPLRPPPRMWLSWKSIIKPRGAQGAVQSDSAMSTTSTAAITTATSTAASSTETSAFLRHDECWYVNYL